MDPRADAEASEAEAEEAAAEEAAASLQALGSDRIPIRARRLKRVGVGGVEGVEGVEGVAGDHARVDGAENARGVAGWVGGGVRVEVVVPRGGVLPRGFWGEGRHLLEPEVVIPGRRPRGAEVEHAPRASPERARDELHLRRAELREDVVRAVHDGERAGAARRVVVVRVRAPGDGTLLERGARRGARDARRTRRPAERNRADGGAAPRRENARSADADASDDVMEPARRACVPRATRDVVCAPGNPGAPRRPRRRAIRHLAGSKKIGETF